MEDKDLKHNHTHGEECGCGHNHNHEHGEECGCGHNHNHEHNHGEECGCGHHHEHSHGEGCSCGHDHDEDLPTVTLTLEDNSQIECAVLGSFDVDDKEYIAVVPLDSDEALIYNFSQHENGEIELTSIETDEEFEKASEAFYEFFAEEFEDEDEDEEEYVYEDDEEEDK